MRLGILTSHPIQYQAPWFRALSKEVDLEVFFAHRQTAAEQGKAGFGVAFDWDVDLLSGYCHRFLENVSPRPGVNHFSGCDTPEIAAIIGAETPSPPRSGRGKGEVSIPSPAQDPSPIFQLSSSTRRRFDAFIVTGWHLKSYWQAVRACRRAGIPVLVRGDSQLLTPRSFFKRWAKELVHRILLRQFDGFLTVGKRNCEYLEHYGVPPEKFFFAPHFVDNEWFRGKAEMARDPLRLDRGEGQGEASNPFPSSNLPSRVSDLRRQWGANDSDFVALFVGKFIPKKRPLDLLRALSTLNSQPSTINYSAVFVGSGELGCQLRDASHVVFDAEANSSLSASIPLAHPMGEGSRVRASESGERAGVRCSSQPSTINPQLSPPARPRAAFAGFKNQSELPACYAAADVLILPSDGGETWGLVVNEAMACGLPAIVSDAVGCAPDLINEGKTGFTFPLGDVAALTEKLAAFARMKRAGHDFAPALAEKMRRYSVEAAVRGTVEAVKKLKAESRK